jgi:ATP-dependent DNA helicase RecQ
MDPRDTLRDTFGFEQFRPGQAEAVGAALADRDALVVMPTGAGKSLCYQLPALMREDLTLVVSPLVSLMHDQASALERVAPGRVELINAQRGGAANASALERVLGGGVRLLYVAPERFAAPRFAEALARTRVGLFVVDEAHCISQWGHDFRPAYLALPDAIRALGRPPILALTATATPDVIDDILRQLGAPAAEVVNVGIERPNLVFEVHRTVNRAMKQDALLRMLREQPGSVIVYAATVRKVEELYSWLVGAGIAVGRYHGKLRNGEREESQARFMSGETQVMVATSAFGMGIDKRDIRSVVHWNFPDSLETYVQEAGRAGRDGKPALAALLYRLEDKRVQSFFLGGKYPRREDTLAVWAAVRRGEATVRELAERTALPEKRVKVIAAQLVGVEAVERRRRKLAAVRALEPAQLEELLSAYEKRHASDRERLDEMMRYAQSTACRVRKLREYFADEPGEPCGKCDNCRRPAARFGDAIRIVSPNPASPPPFRPGDEVRHRTYGAGQVIEVDGDKIVVAFPHKGKHKIRAEWLARAQRSRARLS